MRRYRYEYNLADHFGAVAARKRILFERRLDRLPEPRDSGSALCDVGAGDGLFLEIASVRGWNGVGIDPNPPAAERARDRGFDVIDGLLEDAVQLPSGEFDLVTAWDTIEHTPEPRLFASRLAELVAPAGVVALSTLNRCSAVSAVFRSRWSMIVADHFTFWNKRSLTRLLTSVGLSVEDVRYYGLGRDFFGLVDWVSYKRPSRLTAAGEGSDWTTAGRVLTAEDLVNKALNATHTGVEIEVIARKRETPCGSRHDRY